MSTINDSDLLLVERNGNLHQITYDQMSTLNDDDILLVERGGVQYKVEAQYVSTGPNGVIVTPVEVLTPINGAGITEFDQYEPLSSAITAVGGGGTFDRTTDEIQSAVTIPQTWTSTDGNTFTGPLEVGSYLKGLGVTAITGIKLYMDSVDGFPYTAELTSLTIDGNDYESQNSVTPTNIIGTPYSSEYSFESFFSTASSYGSVQGTNDYSCNFSAISFNTSVQINFATLGGRISVYDQNGEEHFVIGPSATTVLSFPTNTNFDGLQVNQLLSDYATFDPDSGNGSGGVLSEDKLTLSTGPGQYIERLSDVVAFNGSSYAEYTMSGSSDLAGGVGVGAAGATLYGGAGTCIMYRYNGQVVNYPGNNLIFTLDSWGDGDVIGVRLNMTNPSNPTVHFSKNGTSLGSVGLSQFSITEDLFAFASLWPGTQSSMTANFGASGWEITPPAGQAHLYAGLNSNVTIQAINAAATPPTITVSGGTWDTSNQSQVWSAGITTPSNAFFGGSPATNAFDGDLATFAGAADVGEDMVFQPTTSVSYSDSVEVYISGHAGQIILNSNSPVATTDSPGWVTLVSGSSGSISSITIDPNSNRRATITAIRVDGSILADALEDSQVWSDGTYTGTAPSSNYGVKDLFANAGRSGDAFGANKLWGLYQATGSFALDNPIPLTPTSTLKLITYQSNQGSSGTLTLAGPGGSVQAPLTINNVNVLGETTIDNPYASLGDSITSITIAASGGDWTALESIYVDGKPVIDAGTRDLGGTNISTAVSYEKSLTFTDTTQLANMVGPLEMTDATGGNSLTPTTSNVVSSSFTPASSFFNTTLYTGNASSTVQTFDTGVDMQNNGGMIWFKSRQHGQAARILDTYRGTRPSLIPSSSTGNNNLGADGLTYLDDGFSIGWEGNDIASSYNYVAWSFAEKPGFFDIVTWDGNNTNREIAHNLGSVPGFIMVKRTSANEDWTCYHKSLGSNTFIQLNSANASSGLGSFMNDTEPTSTHFSIGTHDRVNTTGHSYIAYIFADNPSNQIKCGSYAGTGPGMTVDVGFRPHWVMLKSSSNSSTNWVIADSSRPNEVLWPNSPDAAYPHSVSFTDTGFTLDSNSSYMNNGGYTYIYIAIGEVGVQAQTELTFQDNTALSALTSGMTIASNGGLLSVPTFSVDTYSGNNGTQSIDNGIDLAGEGGLTWLKYRDGQFGSGHYLFDTERGNASINSNGTDQEHSPDNRLNFDSSGFNVTIDGGSATNATDYRYVAWSFRKAPGFFDIQTWTGNDVAGRTIPHNLGTAPGMILVKRRNDTSNWVVYHKSLGATHPMVLNWYYAAEPITNRWNDTEPTSTEFTVGTWPTNGAGYDYVAYIFADESSNEIKCGSYLGNATGGGSPAVPNQIDCGFRPKFVLIKNAGNTTNWHIFDDQRGDRWLLADENGAEGFSSDPPVVFNDTGFSLPTGYHHVNQENVEHIFMAIGSSTTSGGPAIGTLITDADPSTNKVSVDTTSWPTGNTVTGPSLSASLTSILEVSGNTIFGNGSTGTWIPGYYAEGSEINAAPPGPSEITFTSQNQGTPAFSGVDATLASRTWTLESGTTATGPWTVVDSYVDYDVLNSQTGATPWTSNKPTLQPNTYYRIKVQYNSTNADSVESVYNTFKTGDA